MLQPIGYLLDRPKYFRLERKLAGSDLHRRIRRAFARHTQQRSGARLAPWQVIVRRITQGTRTEQGSRALALLASIIETCRKRNLLPWPYLAKVIAERRKGQPAPPIPAPLPAV